MTLKRIGVLSCGKLMGLLYAVLGFFGGLIISLFSLLGFAIGAASGEEHALGFLFGAGAIIFLPIFYGLVGFLAGLLVSAVYNVAARFTGGLELELR